MQDMHPRSDRSIRNIPVSNHHHRRTPMREEHSEPMGPRPRRSRRRFWQWGAAVVLVAAAGGLLLSGVFTGAKVTIYPKTEPLTGPLTVNAQVNAPDGVLAFQYMILSASATTTVKASGTEHVSKSASGLITIYNTFSSASQQFVANTRFAAPDGKIYRVRVPVSVPGDKKLQDGSVQPGVVTVTVYADKPGADYNQGDGTRFTVPGLQGDARYSKFYAIAQGPIAGGFVGDQPGVSDADMAAAQKALESQLQTTLSSGASANVPDGFLLADSAGKITYSDIIETAGGDGTAALSQTARGSFSIVNSSQLAAALAKQQLSDYQGEPVDFLDRSQLSLSATTTGRGDGSRDITVNGSPTLVWQIDTTTLKSALAGKDKSGFETIVANFGPAITKAEATIRPFWKTVFPSDENKITVVIKQ